jgi:hypothetical protein
MGFRFIAEPSLGLTPERGAPANYETIPRKESWRSAIITCVVVN